MCVASMRSCSRPQTTANVRTGVVDRGGASESQALATHAHVVRSSSDVLCLAMCYGENVPERHIRDLMSAVGMGTVGMHEASYFRLHNRASGPEVVNVWGLNGPLLPQTHWKRWGAKPPTFSNWFCRRRGALRPQKSTIFGPEASLRNRK
jgi:hypothetical protein